MPMDKPTQQRVTQSGAPAKLETHRFSSIGRTPPQYRQSKADAALRLGWSCRLLIVSPVLAAVNRLLYGIAQRNQF